LECFDARLLALALVLWPVLSNPVVGTVTTTGDVRQPRNIYELVYAFDHTFERILSKDEFRLISTRSPEEIRETHPELYSRVSQDVTAWTDEWIRHVEKTIESVSERRLAAARQMAAQVDALLSKHFVDKGWPYRRLSVVFLPPRLFLDERDRGKMTGGMFIPFYPDAFFAAVDWPIPMETVLVHESLHYNSTGRRFGPPLAEGITETGTRYLILKYGLLSERDVSRRPIYESERKGVDLLLDEIVKRTEAGRDEATEQFLAAYLTGDQERMNKVFGVETWERVIKLSQSQDDWQSHKIKKVLEN